MNKHASINRAFRLIWNDAVGAWIPVAEIARGRTKGSRRGAAALAILAAAAGLSPSLHAADLGSSSRPHLPLSRPAAPAPDSAVALHAAAARAAAPAPTALPTEGTVVAGAASIASSTTSTSATLDVDQTSERAVIDWNTFNVGSAAQVNFNQPNSAAVTLNRVLDSNASQIFGEINAPGQVFLSNPNGVYFGKSASVDVGSLTATTSSIGNADFMAGIMTFARNGATGSVINDGTLHAALGGYIALLAPHVRNSGVVVAHMGTVVLAAGDSITLSFDGTHLAGIAAKPSTIAALIENKSAVLAPGGLIILSAPALDRLQGGVIKNSGVLEATSMTTKGGRVVLEAGDVTQSASGSIQASGTEGGSVEITAAQDITIAGSIDAHAGGSVTLNAGRNVTMQDASLDVSGNLAGGSIAVQGGSRSASAAATADADAPTISLLGDTQLRASSAQGRGGQVSLTATRVGMFDSSSVEASGATGGGTIFVGGGFHGSNPSIADAQQVLIGDGATIDASATQSGNGGNVAVWSDGETSFGGSIAARGGNAAGAGGFVEVSGKGTLEFLGSVAADAPHGLAGTLLLDPTNIIVATGGSSTLAANPLTFATNAGTDSTIDPTAITTIANAGTAVSLQASNDLTINSSIETSAGSGTGGNLAFRAGRNITVNASVISDNGNISFTTNDSGANATYRASGAATFTNNSVIDAGSGTVTILMDTFAGTSGTINTGHTAGANLSITQNGPTLGAVVGAIDLGQSDITGNSTIAANSARNVTNTLGATGNAGNVVIRGTSSISVGSGDVTLSGPHTDFNIIGLTAGNVTLNDTNAVQFATTSISGTLTETTIGPIGSTGSVQVAGLTTLTANSGGFGIGDPYIALTNSANHFAGGLVMSVPGTGSSGTGGYAAIRDSGAVAINSSNTAAYLSVQAAGAVTLGTTVAGSSVTVSTTSGGVSTGSTTAGTYMSITAAGAVDLGTTTLGTDLTVSTAGAITDSGTLTAPRQTTLTAGAANNITLDSPNNDFSSIQIISSNNTTLVDKNAINFGYFYGWYGYGVYPSSVSGNFSVTAGGDISQTGYNNSNSSAITVGGTSTFTANSASAPINLWLGTNSPFNPGSGSANNLAGTVTLARNNTSTGFSNVELRNVNSGASVLTGLTSVGTLANVYLTYDNAPSVSLPGMTVTGNLELYAASVANTASTPTNIISQTGPIVVGGNTIMAAASTGDIRVNNASNDFNSFGIANTGARNLTLVDANAINLYAPGYNQGITGNLSVTSNGLISDTANYFSIAGTTLLNPGTANNISLTASDAFGGAVTITAANNVVIQPYTNLIFGNASIAGTLSVVSENYGYALTQAAGTAITMANTSATTSFGNFSAGVTVANAGNVLGALAITQAGAVTITENDAITQSSAWTSYNGSNAYPVALTTSNDQAITLNQSGSYFGPLTVTQVNSGATSAGAVYIREDADSINGMTEGSAWTVHGTTTLNSGAYSITLNNANNILGPLQVLGATGSTGSTPVPSTVTLYAKNTASTDAISDVGGIGAWNTGTGVVKLIAYDATGATAGGGNITLSNAGNVLGDLYIKATNATITENDIITDGASTSWDAAGDTGWVTTGATNLIVANATGKSITLDNVTNQLGPVGISTVGAAGTLTGVLITDNTDLTQAAVWSVGAAPVTLDARTHNIDLSSYGNVLGNLSINTANGTPTSVKITENDAITQGSVWALTGVPVTLVAQSGDAITLTNSSNIMGNLTVTGGAVSITENGSITQGGAWTTTGTTTLNVSASSGSGIALTNAANVLGAIAIAGTPNAVSITENHDITQASAWVQGSAPFTLNAGTHNIVLSQANNVLGDLTLTAANATVTENDPNGITDGGAWAVSGTTTLTAGSANPIVLNANPASDFGTVNIVSASNADINDVNGINFGTSAIAAGGTLTVTAGGAITQTGAITAPNLRLIGAGSATLSNTSNDVGTLSAGFSGGDLVFNDGGSFAIGVIGGTTGVTIGAHNVSLTSATGTITGLSNINASSASLTLVTGTALSLPQMTIAGAQTYTASTVSGNGITLNAGLDSTAAGAITFNSPVTLAADLSVQSTNSAISFGGALAGGSNQLTVNAGTGLVNFGGVVTALGSTSDAGAALSLTSSGATFTSTLSANNGLAITGPVTFDDTVTLADGNAASVFTGLVTLGKAGGMNLSGYNGMSFNGGVLLQNGATTINSNNSPLTFQNSSVSGPYALTLNSGTAALSGLNFMGGNLTSLTVTALSPSVPSGGVSIAGPQTYTATSGSSVTLNGAVTGTAAGTITFNSPVSMGASTSVTSSNSPVVFASTVDGNHDLTVSAGSGTTTFTGAVGAVAPLGDGTGAAVILQGSGATTFSSTVQTRSGMTAAGAVTFSNNATFANGDTGSAFTGLVTTGGSTGNSISSFDGIAFNGGLALVGGPVSIASNGSTLAFGGPVAGTQTLTLNALAAGAGTVTGLAQIGFASNLTGLAITAQTLSLPSSGLAVAGPMAFTAAGGITVNGAVGNGATSLTGEIDFNSPVIITIASNNAAVNFNGTVNGAQALTVNAGSGITTFGGAVGANTAVTSLTTGAGGSTAINGGSIHTSGAQAYNDAVTLGADATLTGVNVHFNGTLNGAHALTVDDSGTTAFGAIVGGVTPLTSITTDAPGSVAVNAAAVSTSGAQTYNEDMTLGANVSFSGMGLTFGATVDGAYSLSANAGSGALRLLGAVGGATAITSLNALGNTIAAAAITSAGAQSLTATSGITLNGNLHTTASAVTLTGATTLGGNVTVASSGGNITFSGGASTINGAHALTLTAGTGNVVLGGVVGGVTPLTALTISGYDLTLPGISTVGDANQSYTALDNITLNQSRTVNAPITFTADADGDGNGSFILLNGVSLTASNNTLSITAADIDLQGNSTLSSGSGLMSLTATDNRNIALGGADAAGQMTISGSELSRISSSGGLSLNTNGAGWVHVNGINGAQSQNITGTLSLDAHGTGDVSFLTAASTFNALTASANSGLINVGVNLTSSNDPIVFVTPVSVSGASTIASGGGAITFDAALSVDNDLTLSTNNGVLSFGGAVGSNKTLTLNLGGGSVSGLGQLQATLTGLTVNATSGITLPAFTIEGPQVYNTGPITATGNLGGIGIAFNNLVDIEPTVGNALNINAATGTLAFNNLASFNADNMTLIGDQINFSRPVTGSGNLTLQPYSVGRNVAVGGSGTPIIGLNLSSAALAEMPIGTLASLTIGSASGTGTLNVAGPLNVAGTPLTLNGGGGITQSGGSIASGTLTLYAAGNAINLANGANSFGGVALNGSPSAVSLTNTLDITQAGTAAWNLGNAPVTLNAGTHDITLNNSGNTFGTLVLNGGNVQVTEAADTDIGASDISHNLSVHSSGAINFSGALTDAGNVSLAAAGEVTQSAPLSIGGNLDVLTTVNAGDVTLDNSGASATSIGDTYVGGDYVLTATGEPISQAAGASLQVAGNLTVTGASIVLGGAGNLVGGTTNLPVTNTAVVTQSGVITLGNRSDSGNLTVVSSRTDRTIGSAPLHGDAIVLNDAGNDISGNISVSASPPTINVGGADVQTGIVQAPNTTISVAGTASFTAEASSAGSIGIDLTNSGNQFSTLLLSANTVNVANSAAALTTIGNALATTSLTLTMAGGIAQTGAITTPTLNITANGAVTLNNPVNDVASLAVVSTGNPISYVDANDFAVAGIDAGGSTLSLTAGGSGSLTQTGSIQHVSVLNANAGGAVTLGNSGNGIATLGTSTAGTGLQVLDSNAVDVSGVLSSTAGDLSVRSIGDLTLDSGGRLMAPTGSIIASTENAGNFINDSLSGATALVTGSGARWLVYSDTPDLVAGPHTVKGGLTSAFRHYGATYATYAPGSVTESGDGFIYSQAANALTVSAVINGTPSQVYGSAPTATLGYAISSGLLDSEDSAGNVITGGAATYNTALSNTMNAGTYGVLYTGGLTSNYTLTPSTTAAVYTVTPAQLTYAANSASRLYGAANPALSGSIGGFVLGQTAASVLSGTAVWTTPAVATSNVGAYAINGGGYTLNGGNTNYTFAQAAGNSTALSIGKAALTVTAANAAKTYDGLAYSGGNGVSYSAFANGESASVLGGVLAYGGTSQGARNAGTYSVTPSGLTSGNYTITYSNGTLTVGRAILALTTSAVTKTYNGTLAALGSAAATSGTQLFGSDTVSGGTFAFTNANAGNRDKTVTVSGVTLNDGNGGGNYNVSYVSNTASTINPASITVSANNAVKTYDGTLSATTTADLASGTLYHNVSNGNALDSLSGGSFAYTDANAGSGNKTVSVGGVTVNDGNGGGNYTVTYLNNTASTINQAALSIVATVAERAYDGTITATLSGYTISGLVGGQTLDARAGSAVFSDKNAGTAKTVNISGVALADGTNGGLASNYHINPTATATGTIDPKLLTVNAVAANKVYNATTAATVSSYGLAGFVGSETVVPVYTGSATFADKNVANGKTVTITGINLLNGLNGGLASNYTVAPTATSTANITPATLQVAGAVAVDKVYDGTTAAILNTLGAVLTGVLGSDSVHVGSITGAFQTKDVGVDKPIVGISNFVLTGADAEDYTIVQPSGLTASITPRALTVSAAGVSKVYDATTAGTVTLSDNRIAGDQLAVTSTAAFADKNVGSGKYVAVGSIAISGTDAEDYTANTSTATFANITPATLAVSAVGINRTYDATTSAAVTLSDTPLGNDVVNLTYSSAAFADKNVGLAKTVTVSGISGVSGSGDAGNYVITPVATTTATITPATITQVTGVNAANKVYDGTTTATLITGTLGFVGEFAGDSLAATPTNAAFDNKNAGVSKTVTIGGVTLAGPDAGNYVLASIGTTISSADITPRVLTVSASGDNKVYDTTTAATVALTDNRIAGDALSIASSDAFLDKNAGNGKYISVSDITLSGADAGNYTVNSNASTSANITPAVLTVSAAGTNKVYDATAAAGVTLSDDPLGTDVVNTTYTSAAFTNKNVGIGKTIAVSGISLGGADAGNYMINGAVTATANITPATLIVTASASPKPYDGNTAATVSLSDDRYAGDQLSLTDSSAAFASSAPGNGKTVTVSGVIIAGGADRNNYILEDTSLTSTGIITGDDTEGAAGTASLPPILPPSLTTAVTTPPPSTVDLALPAGFGGQPTLIAVSIASLTAGTASATSADGIGSASGTNGRAPTDAAGALQAQAGAASGATSMDANSPNASASAGAVAGAESAQPAGAVDSTVIVSLVSAATLDHRGMVTVSVPKALVSTGKGFSFALPREVSDALAQTSSATTLRVTRQSGKALPKWIRYLPGTQMFRVTAVSAQALPAVLLLRSGQQRWTMIISERSE